MNHTQQAALFRHFCHHYSYNPIRPSEPVLCRYIAFLTNRFKSARSVRNYVSGIRFMHKSLGLTPPATDTFQVSTMLRAADIMLRNPPRRVLPITATLLHKLCTLSLSMGDMGLVLRVAMTLGYFGMLRQSNLAPAQAKSWDPSRHTCRGDITFAKPGLVLNIKWTKSAQICNTTPLVPIPHVQGAITDPVAAYRHMLHIAPTRHPEDPLLLLPARHGRRVITIHTLRKAFAQLLELADLSLSKYTLHSLRRGGGNTVISRWSTPNGRQTSWHVGLRRLLGVHNLLRRLTVHSGRRPRPGVHSGRSPPLTVN